jgi:protein-disulfide isomerase
MSTLRVPVTSHEHVRGRVDALIALVEYGDYECPACGAARPHMLLVQEHFGRRLRFVFRHFPLSQVHPNAETAAETAEYAGAHRRFRQMHDGLYENQDRLGLPLYFALAGRLGLSEAGLRNALATGEFASTVRADFLGGVRSGVNGTASFFINDRRHDGSYEFDDLAAAIETHLSALETEVANRHG